MMTYTAVASTGSATAVTGTQSGSIADTVNIPKGGTVTYSVSLVIPSGFAGDLENIAQIMLPPVNSYDTAMANNSDTVKLQEVYRVLGTIYNDVTGLIDHRVNDGNAVVGFSDLKIVAVDNTQNTVTAVTPVSSSDGSYTLTGLPEGDYDLVLIYTSNPPAVGDDATGLTSSLPAAEWEHTGEFWGAGQGSDGTPDGILEISINGMDATNANFGIRVSNPCSLTVNGTAFKWSTYDGTANPVNGVVTKQITQPAANGGFVFDIYTLDNSFNMNINGIQLASQEIQFQGGDANNPINIKFQDGDEYENQAGVIWQMNGDKQHPLIRVKIDASGAVTMYGSKASGGPLFPLELFNGNTFNNISWNATGTNNITVVQSVIGPTVMDGYGYGLNITDCNPLYTITKDGVFNDANSDGYAEVGETITYTIEVENIGTNPAYNVVVNDTLLGGDITVTPTGDGNNNGSMDDNPRETWTYTVTYIVTQQDIDNGGVYNQASVTGGNGVGNRFDPVLSTDPTPLSPGEPHYDPARPNYTFVPLKKPPSPVTVNPQLYNPAKDNGN